MDPTIASRIARFSELKARMPNSELPRWSLAQALEAASDLPAAIAEYRELVQLKPDYCMAWLRLGALLSAQAEAGREAREALERAVSLARAQGHEAPRTEAAQLLAALDDD
jgi:tetratricopeptide (TPR) repeat protein